MDMCHIETEIQFGTNVAERESFYHKVQEIHSHVNSVTETHLSLLTFFSLQASYQAENLLA